MDYKKLLVSAAQVAAEEALKEHYAPGHKLYISFHGGADVRPHENTGFATIVFKDVAVLDTSKDAGDEHIRVFVNASFTSGIDPSFWRGADGEYHDL